MSDSLVLTPDMFTSGGLSTYDPNGSLTGLTDPSGYSTTAPTWVNNRPLNEGGSFGGYGSASAQQAGQDEAAYWDAQSGSVNNQLGQLDPQQNIGLQNIGNSYNQSANRLDQQKGLAQRDYNTNTEDNQRSYQTGRNNISTQTANRMTALQRLLGIAGSGNSSAAYESAPYAALREGTQNLQGAQQTYGMNQRKQDTNWQDTLLNYNNNREDLDRQKYTQENGLRSSIAQTRAGLLDKLATIGVNRNLASGQSYTQANAARAPYESQIQSLLSQITNLGSQYANPVMRVGDVSYKAPTLDQYSLKAGRQTAPTGVNPAVADSVNPLLLPLLAKQRDEFGQPI